MSKIKEKLNNIWLGNQQIRRARSFLNLNIFPHLRKIFLFSIFAIIIIFVGLKLFKPQYLEKIYTRFYLASSRYFNFDNYNFNSISISGNNRTSQEEIIDVIKKTQSLQNNTNDSLIKKIIKEIKSELPWVNQISIVRTLPNKLNITIIEYEPFAIWQNNGQKYVIDKDGNKVRINDDSEFDNLIILSGKDANLNAKSLFNVLAANPEFSAKVYSATWIGERRWDIRFENGLLVKLPSHNIIKSWQHLIKIYNTPGSLVNLKVIDLRINDKVYLQYDDNIIKEIKNFKL